MKSMTIRGLKLYFKNKGTVFFSIISVIIMFALFAFFLEENMAKSISDIPGSRLLINSWVVAGMLATTSISSSLGAYTIMVTDKDDKIIKDFYSSPMKRRNILLGYIITGIVVSIIMSLLTFAFGEVYLLIKGGTLLSVVGMIQMLLLMIISSFSASAIICFIISFVKKTSTYTTISVLFGTLIGFLTGTYLPIGSLPNSMKTFVKLFPPMHSASLFRQIMMKDYIEKGFSQASPEAVDEFKQVLGVTLTYNGTNAPTFVYVLVLLFSGLLFYSLAVYNISRKAKSLNH